MLEPALQATAPFDERGGGAGNGPHDEGQRSFSKLRREPKSAVRASQPILAPTSPVPVNGRGRPARGVARLRVACYRSWVGALTDRLEKGLQARGAALMGVLNVTPDSFYDGGHYLNADDARQRVDQLLAD